MCCPKFRWFTHLLRFLLWKRVCVCVECWLLFTKHWSLGARWQWSSDLPSTPWDREPVTYRMTVCPSHLSVTLVPTQVGSQESTATTYPKLPKGVARRLRPPPFSPPLFPLLQLVGDRYSPWIRLNLVSIFYSSCFFTSYLFTSPKVPVTFRRLPYTVIY